MKVRTLTCAFSAYLPLIALGLASLAGCGTSNRSQSPYPYVNEDLGSSSPDMGSESPDMLPPIDPRFTVPPTDWQAEHPTPSFGWINHIFPISQNDAWLAGGYGTVLHWDGTQLTRMPQITTSSLYEVWSSGPNDVWAIGSAGVVIHYDGTAWKPVFIDASDPLTSIWGSSANDIWVTAGNDGFFSKSGQLFHWDGSKFSKAIPDTSSPLFKVYGRNQSDVWVVGYYGTAMHWNGSQWSPFSPRVADKDLNAIWAAAANDVWFVGDSGTSLHWNGSTFTPVATNLPSPIFSGPPDLWSVSGFAANNLWALGGNRYLIHGDGTKWDPYISPSISTSTLWHRAANELWIAGSGIDRYNGTTFTPLLPGTHRVDKLFGTGLSDMFAQSDALMRRDATGKWNKMTLPNNTPLIAMWASSPSDLWVVNSSRQHFRYNGSTWSQRTTSGVGPIYFSSTFAAGPNDYWLADTTYNNQLWRFNGSTYTQYSVVGAGGTEKFGPLWGSASNDVWSAGANSDFYHWDGTRWSPVVTGITPSLAWYGISGSAANDLWFVADQGKVGHYDGTSWTVMESPAKMRLNSVFARSPSDVWAVGYSGAIVHYDGQTWSAMESGTRNTLTAVWALSSGDVWAAGENGLLLHLKR